MKLMKAALAATFACAALAAADPKGLDFAVKFKAGTTAGNLKDDTHDNKLLGLSFAGSWSLGDGASFIGELGYSYFGGGEFDAMQRSGTFYYNPASPSSTYNGNPVTLIIVSPSGAANAQGSADARRNKLEGFSARFGYARKFFGTWSWQAGLTLDKLKSRQEVAGTLRPVYLAGTTPTPIPVPGQPTGVYYYEALSATPESSKVNVGAFAGVKTAIGENFSFEINLLSVGYSQVNYVPFTYSGVAAQSTTSTRRGLGLEFAFGLKL